MLNDKIEEAKRKKNVLIARKKRAEAQKAIQETMSGLRDQSAFETFDRMAGKIDQMEAEAEAQTELAEEYSGDVLASQFQQLEKTHGADDDLVALKRKMGMLPPEEAEGGAAAGAGARRGARAGRQQRPSELAAALEELEAEHQADGKRRSGALKRNRKPRSAWYHGSSGGSLPGRASGVAPGAHGTARGARRAPAYRSDPRPGRVGRAANVLRGTARTSSRPPRAERRPPAPRAVREPDRPDAARRRRHRDRDGSAPKRSRFSCATATRRRSCSSSR
jgi:hypothetical protein